MSLTGLFKSLSPNINNNNSDLSNITNKTCFRPKTSTDSGLKHCFLTRMSKE